MAELGKDLHCTGGSMSGILVEEKESNRMGEGREIVLICRREAVARIVFRATALGRRSMIKISNHIIHSPQLRK